MLNFLLTALGGVLTLGKTARGNTPDEEKVWKVGNCEGKEENCQKGGQAEKVGQSPRRSGNDRSHLGHSARFSTDGEKQEIRIQIQTRSGESEVGKILQKTR